VTKKLHITLKNVAQFQKKTDCIIGHHMGIKSHTYQ